MEHGSVVRACTRTISRGAVDETRSDFGPRKRGHVEIVERKEGSRDCPVQCLWFF